MILASVSFRVSRVEGSGAWPQAEGLLQVVAVLSTPWASESIGSLPVLSAEAPL